MLCIPFLLFGCTSFGQADTVISLISKVDIAPQYQLHDGNKVMLMGYSNTIGGSIHLPSPTIELREGDSVELNLWNLSQGPPHTIHLHGLDVNQQNDGVPMLSFAVAHDDTGTYRFKVPHPGTYVYHCHETSVLHVQAGMYGLLIVRPQSADTLTWDGGYAFHSERAWLLTELDTNWHVDSIINHTYDPLATTHEILDYNPQHFLINGLSEHQLIGNVELNAAKDEIVYLRLAGIGYLGNQVVFPPELNATVISSDGRPIPTALQLDTLEIMPGERYGVLLQSSVDLNSVLSVDYFDLNTGSVVNTQNVNVTVEGLVGHDELQEPNEWTIYPNPSTDVITLKAPDLPAGEYEIFAITNSGMIAAHQQINLMQPKELIHLDLSDLQSGTYTIVLATNKSILIDKLILLKP